MEGVSELEQYRWGNEGSASKDPVDTLLSAPHESTSVEYRWTAVREPSGGPDRSEPAHIIIPRKRAQASTDGQQSAAEKIHPKRTVPSMVRFTPDEFLIVAERARTCGRPPARYIREAALGAVPKARRTTGSAELIRELSDIGNTLQELRTIAESACDESVAERCEAVLLDVLDAIRRVG